MQFGFLAGLGLIIVLIIVIFLVVNAIFLGVALGFVNGRNRDLGDTFFTALGMALLGWIPILGCIISWYLIKTRHDTGWGGAIIAWLLTGIIAFIVLIVVLFATGMGLSAIFGVLPISP